MRVIVATEVKQLLHGELDALREECGSSGLEVPVDLEVEGGLVEGQEESASLEAEREATAVLAALRRQEQQQQQEGAAAWLGEACAEGAGWDSGDWGALDDGLPECIEEAPGRAPGCEAKSSTGLAVEEEAPDRAAGCEAKSSTGLAVEEEFRSQQQRGPGAPGISSLFAKTEALTAAPRVLDRPAAREAESSTGVAADGELRSEPQRGAGAFERPAKITPSSQTSPDAARVGKGKPLVDPPEFGDRIKDTEKDSCKLRLAEKSSVCILGGVFFFKSPHFFCEKPLSFF